MISPDPFAEPAANRLKKGIRAREFSIRSGPLLLRLALTNSTALARSCADARREAEERLRLEEAREAVVFRGLSFFCAAVDGFGAAVRAPGRAVFLEAVFGEAVFGAAGFLATFRDGVFFFAVAPAAGPFDEGEEGAFAVDAAGFFAVRVELSAAGEAVLAAVSNTHTAAKRAASVRLIS